MTNVAGIQNLGPPTAEAPLAWCKETAGGLGLIRIHWARESHVTACGQLNLKTSPYAEPGYTPLHIAYKTTAQAISAARSGVLYANKTGPASSICKLCQRSSDLFGSLVSRLEV